MRTFHRLLGPLGAIVFLAFIAIAFTPSVAQVGAALQVAEPPRPADAIVVLGGGQAGEGELSRPSLRRAVRGVALHNEGYAPLLVMLGPGSRPERSEAIQRASLAESLGVDASAIIVEDGARTTWEEAMRIRERLTPYGVRSILLVSDSQHLIRAKLVFEQAGFEVIPVAADDIPTTPKLPLERMEYAKRILEEWAARVYYRVTGRL